MLQHHVKDQLSNVALNNLNTCVQSCQDASQLINESKYVYFTVIMEILSIFGTFKSILEVLALRTGGI